MLRRCCVQRQKTGTFLRAVAVPYDKPTFNYAELVSWSHLKWFTRATSIRYEDKTTAGVPGLQLVDTLWSCTFVPSRPSYFKLYMKLVLCCRITRWCNKYRIEAAKMLNNWPKWGKNRKECEKKKYTRSHGGRSFQSIGRSFHKIVSSLQKKGSSLPICYIYF